MIQTFHFKTMKNIDRLKEALAEFEPAATALSEALGPFDNEGSVIGKSLSEKVEIAKEIIHDNKIGQAKK